MATVSGPTAAAFSAYQDTVATELSAKADLVGGVVPDTQVPAIAMKRGEIFVNVKDKGAKGDGVTSDDAALAAAIASINPTFGGKVLLPPGQYLLTGTAALALSVAGTVIEGSGSEVTKIVIGAGFTGPEAISITASNCQVRGLSIVGANSTTTSNPVAGGVQVYGARRTKISDVNFWYINAWALEVLASTSSASGNPDGTMLERIVIRQCAGGIHFLGNTISGYAVNSFVGAVEMLQIGVTTGPSANLDAFKVEDSWDILVSNIMVWVSSGTGSSLHVKGNCAATFIQTLDALGPSGAPNVLIEDGPNGSPQNVQIDGGVIQQGSIGLRITGGANNIHPHNIRFINNVTHGLSVEGTGSTIFCRNLFFSSSGTGAAGNNYDVNWSGSSTGYMDGCRFGSSIVAVGTAGVQQSVNIAAGQNVRFLNVSFQGTGAATSNWFSSGMPSVVLETASNQFYFAGNAVFANQATLTGGGIAKSNFALQPSAPGNTVLSINQNGSAGFDTFRLTGDGKIAIGPNDGSAARDTFLYRLAANSLKTDGAFTVGTDLVVGSTTWTTYTPVVSGGGSATWNLLTGWYKKFGKIVVFETYIVASAAGSGTSTLTFTLPSAPYRDGNGTQTTRQTIPVQIDNCVAGSNSFVSGSGLALAFASGSGTTVDAVRGPTNITMQGQNVASNTILTIQGWYREA